MFYHWLFILLVLQSCTQQPEKIKQPAGISYCLDSTFKNKIAFTKAQKKLVDQNIALTGSVEPNPDRVVHFVSLVDGIISNTYFSLGDQVVKGQVLAELRSAQLSDLYAQSKSIESRISVAEKKLQMTQSMLQDGIASEKEYLEVKSEVDILKAEKEKIYSILNLYSAIPEKGVFQIKAPASGFITAKSIAAGTQITAGGEVLFTISDLSQVWIMINVYASNVKNIQVGMEVGIKTLSYPGETFYGKIGAISQVYDSEAKVLKARVVFPNPDYKLKPGMLVDVLALKQEPFEALAIPTDAIIFDDNQHFVVVYKDDCNIETRKIEILAKTNGTTFISSGLNEDENIITQNHLLIYQQLKNF
ncbi:MAG: efflux RND transporter periplasmic adaptor subunit [Bacteroidia bacterium]|nr:efflux RND transporter periplasmic adaptor subunit [Bacteroidia bacterium]MDW8158909.1 efflux RND transporter periplasmic adaptor subunit [Bacteroidia bacterium]